MPTIKEQTDGARECQRIVRDELNKLKYIRASSLCGYVGEERDKVDNQIDILRIALVRMYNEVR